MQTLASLRFNKSTAVSQAGGWKHLQKPSAYQPHPPLTIPHPPWESLHCAASCRCQVVALCKYTVYCLLLVWQYPGMKAGRDQGGRAESLGGKQRKKPCEGDAKSLSLSARKSKRVTARKGFFFSRLLIPHLHIFDSTATKEKCETDGV